MFKGWLRLTMLSPLAVMSAGPALALQAMEWEPDEGYHEEEWYDPSDWFDDDTTIDYEYDWWDDYDPYDGFYGYGYDPYGYYGPRYYTDDGLRGDSDLDYGWHYDRGDDDWEYGWHYDNIQYDYGYLDRWTREGRDRHRQEIQGRIVSIGRTRVQDGQPESVRLKLQTDDGQTRTLHLGDVAYVRENLPRLRQGETVRVRGEMVNVNGRRMFKAAQLRGQGGEFDIPDYEWNRSVKGEVVGIRSVHLSDDVPQALVARVRTNNNRTIPVLLGPREALRDGGHSLRPGARVDVRGYERELNGQRTFVVQDIEVDRRGMRDKHRQQQAQQRDERTRARTAGNRGS